MKYDLIYCELVSSIQSFKDSDFFYVDMLCGYSYIYGRISMAFHLGAIDFDQFNILNNDLRLALHDKG